MKKIVRHWEKDRTATLAAIAAQGSGTRYAYQDKSNHLGDWLEENYPELTIEQYRQVFLACMDS